MDWTTYFFRFEGRINRALMWQALLIVALMTALMENLVQAVELLDGTKSAVRLGIDFDFDFGLDDLFRLVDPDGGPLLTSKDRPALIAKVLSTPLLLWVFLATAIKRLHDRNRSGWWIILFFFLPNLLMHLFNRLPQSGWLGWIDWAVYAVWGWSLVELFILRGTSGDNRFGPDPLAETKREAETASSAGSWDQQREIEIVPPSASPPGGMHVKRGA